MDGSDRIKETRIMSYSSGESYTEVSTLIKIPDHLKEKASRFILGLREVPEFVVTQDYNIWLLSKEHVDLEVMAAFVKDLVKSIGLDEPVIVEWAVHCNTNAPGEFGGGAFVVMKDCPVYWIDPPKMAEKWIKRNKKRRKK
jgi:hypothetical protein